MMQLTSYHGSALAFDTKTTQQKVIHKIDMHRPVADQKILKRKFKYIGVARESLSSFIKQLMDQFFCINNSFVGIHQRPTQQGLQRSLISLYF
jgi:hypothetical protein